MSFSDPNQSHEMRSLHIKRLGRSCRFCLRRAPQDWGQDQGIGNCRGHICPHLMFLLIG